MRLVTKQQLLAMPCGTIFRGFEPCVWRGDWSRFLEPCGDNDFIYCDIGPSIVSDGCDPSRNFDHLVISDDETSRDGCYDASDTYVVLEQADLEAFAAQLLGKPFKEPPIGLLEPDHDDAV